MSMPEAEGGNSCDGNPDRTANENWTTQQMEILLNH